MILMIVHFRHTSTPLSMTIVCQQFNNVISSGVERENSQIKYLTRVVYALGF